MRTRSELVPAQLYRCFDAEDRLLYIGASSNMVGRIAKHEQDKPWWPEVVRIETVGFSRRDDAFTAERAAIDGERPLHNVRVTHRARERRDVFENGAPRDRGRSERMLSAYVDDDMTLEQIGRRYGVTRERVRQLTSGADRTMCLLVIRRRAARGRLRRLVNAGTPQIRTECPVCGSLFEAASNRRYCSPVHQQVAVMMRYQTDDIFRDRQQFATARSVIKSNPADARMVRNAQRVLTGTTTKAAYRWMSPGSLQFHWALRACALGWPIFDAFHEDVQSQIREHLAVDVA